MSGAGPDPEPAPWTGERNPGHAPNVIARRVLRLLLVLVVVPAAVCTGLATLAPGWWLGDLFSHFRIQYLAVGALALPLSLWLGARRTGGLAAVCIALNTIPVWDYFVPEPAELATRPAYASTAVKVPVRIAGANIFYRNRNYDAVAAWIRETDADLTVLVEATPAWLQAMRTELTEYAFVHLVARRGRSGKLLIAREPPEALTALGPTSVRSPTPMVTIERRGARLQVAGVHTEWPMGPERTARRDEFLLDLGRRMRATDLPMVAIGDFNVTPFSSVFETMLDQSGVRRAAAGRGWLPTWPLFFPLAGIQIDHLLHTREIAVTRLRTGAGLGSDHRWLVADLLVPVQPDDGRRSPPVSRR